MVSHVLAAPTAFPKPFLPGCFLLKFIRRMADRHWCAVPVLFLSRALASLPRCKALGGEGLLALR